MTTTALSPFKSAGVLPLRINTNGVVEALLAWEESYGTRRCIFHNRPGGCYDGDQCEYLHLSGPLHANEKEMLRLNFLGGKREPFERVSTETAAREFSEETNEIVSPQEAAALVQQPHVSSVRLYGSYDLYMTWFPEILGKNIVDVYARIPRNPPLACAFALVWVPLELLLNIREDTSHGYHVTICKEARPISHLVWSFCVRHRDILRGLLLAHMDPAANMKLSSNNSINNNNNK
jgi:8-oxo-dGTP pyrophosphatase MutT (NUDIX family)